MPATYYIDGYNVIHQCPQLQPLVHADFEAARDTLVDRISRYCGISGEPAKIIFDGRGKRAEPHAPYRGAPGLEVIYSPGHLTADAVIERAVYASSARREIVVVSGDRGIRDLCRGLGSLVMSPTHYLGMVDEILTRSTAQMKFTYERFSTNFLEDRLDGDTISRLTRLKGELEKEAR